jgi:hypothetical protein
VVKKVKRPLALSVISWILIVLSSLQLLGGLLFAIMFIAIVACEPSMQDPDVKIALPVFLGFVGLMMAIGGFLLFVYIKLYNMKEWARRTAVVLNWIWIVFISIYIIAFIGMGIASFVFGGAGQACRTSSVVAGAAMALFGLIIGIFYAAPAVVINYFLDKPEIKKVMK